MRREVGIQYTAFTRGGGHRQAFFNAIAPENIDSMNEQTLINWASDKIHDIYADKIILIDAINRKGRVSEVHKFS